MCKRVVFSLSIKYYTWNGCNLSFLDYYSYFCFAIVKSSVGSFYGLEILYLSKIATLSPKSILKSVTTHLVKVIYLVEPISARWTCAYISLFSDPEILCVWIFVKICDKKRNRSIFLTIFLAVRNIRPCKIATLSLTWKDVKCTLPKIHILCNSTFLDHCVSFKF